MNTPAPAAGWRGISSRVRVRRTAPRRSTMQGLPRAGRPDGMGDGPECQRREEQQRRIGVASRKTPDITGSATKASAAASPAAGLASVADVRMTAHPATNPAQHGEEAHPGRRVAQQQVCQSG